MRKFQWEDFDAKKKGRKESNEIEWEDFNGKNEREANETWRGEESDENLLAETINIIEKMRIREWKMKNFQGEDSGQNSNKKIQIQKASKKRT